MEGSPRAQYPAEPMLPRRFTDDPLHPSIAMTDDHRGHPVVEIIRRRRAEGSRPGERQDGRRVALAIEGGGMRGVVSAGMTAAIEQLGLRDAFDEVHGASAGAFNAAFLLAGQAGYLATLYQHRFGDRSDSTRSCPAGSRCTARQRTPTGHRSSIWPSSVTSRRSAARFERPA